MYEISTPDRRYQRNKKLFCLQLLVMIQCGGDSPPPPPIPPARPECALSPTLSLDSICQKNIS